MITADNQIDPVNESSSNGARIKEKSTTSSKIFNYWPHMVALAAILFVGFFIYKLIADTRTNTAPTPDVAAYQLNKDQQISTDQLFANRSSVK